MSDIAGWCGQTAAALAAALATGQVTSVQLTEAFLGRIREKNPSINAFLEVYEPEALAQAAASDQRRRQGQPLSPLDGVPIAIKDNLVYTGHRCSCASRMLETFVSPYSATVVERLLAAGLPILGRLNMDEFAMGSSSETGAFGPVRNPLDQTRSAGGSSGGSAAAVAAGMTPLALGSDTGGSIRQPAAFCGVVGVKPAYGAVSRYGLVAFASSLDQVGPLARTARDCALLMDVIAGPDVRDMTSDPALGAAHAEAVAAGWPQAADAPLQGLRVALPRECFDAPMEDAVRQSVLAAAEQLQQLGAIVADISLPSLRHALNAYYLLSAAEASSNLARYDGVRYGHRAANYADVEDLYRQSRAQGFGTEVKRRLLMGTFALSSGYQDRYYLQAQALREKLGRELDAAWQGCDLLLMPTAPTVAYPLGQQRSDPTQLYRGDLFTVAANLAGLPALSLTCGLADGLPVGMQLMGPRQSLPMLLTVADAYQHRREGAPL